MFTTALDVRVQGIQESSELIEALIKSCKSKHLNPRPLESSNPVLHLILIAIFICEFIN